MDKKKNHLPILIGGLLTTIVIVICATFFLSRTHELEPIEPPLTPDVNISTTPPYNFDYSWAKHPYVAHAMGGIFGDTYTNSYEAFLLNYQLGQRVFEVDFSLTDDADPKVVASHDADNWRSRTSNSQEEPFTYTNVRSLLIDGKYHALDIAQLIDLMVKYPDIYIVTDSKYADEANSVLEFKQIITEAKAIDATVLDRFVIQIYHQEMLSWIMSLYPWKSVIYTLYGDPTWTPENVAEFAKASGVKFITMWDTWVTPEIIKLWQPLGINIAAHTVNDYANAESLRALGVSVIYTDFLIP